MRYQKVISYLINAQFLDCISYQTDTIYSKTYVEYCWYGQDEIHIHFSSLE